MEQQKKICAQCGTDFEPKNIGSHPQVYCSKNCRYNANNKRRSAKVTELENRLKDEQQNKDASTGGANFIQAQQRYADIPIFGSPSNSSINPYSILEKQYDAKVEALEFKLKYEELERRYKHLEQENVRLQIELENSENYEEEEGTDWIGAILQNDTVKQVLPLVAAKIFK